MRTIKKASLVLLLTSVVLISCKKDDDGDDQPMNNNNNNNPGITAPYYFKGDVDGEEVILQHGVNFYGNGASSSGGTSGNFISQTEQSEFGGALSVQTVGFGLVVVIPDTTPDFEIPIPVLQDAFQVGVYGYGDEDDNIEGAAVSYTDKQGNFYTSQIGDQTGSTFEILEATDLAGQEGFMKLIKVKFSCKVYSFGGGSKTITNAEAKGRVILL